MSTISEAAFAARLRAVRATRGWTQRQLAARAGYSVGVVSRSEAPVRYPSVDALICMAIALGVSIDYLLGLHVDAAQAHEAAAQAARDEQAVALARRLLALVDDLANGRIDQSPPPAVANTENSAH